MCINIMLIKQSIFVMSPNLKTLHRIILINISNDAIIIGKKKLFKSVYFKENHS